MGSCMGHGRKNQGREMTDRTHPDSGRAIGGIVEALRARISDLEAQLEAIGAGGVSGPLIGQPQAMPDL